MRTVEDKYIKAVSVEDAMFATKMFNGSSKFLAGGTDVMVNRFQGNETNTTFIDLTGIEELKTIKEEKDFLRIGSLVTLSRLEKDPMIQKFIPALCVAAKSVGSPLIRKTATIGGNVLCENRCLYYNQSEWWREAVGYCLKCSGDVCIATGGANACFSEFVSDTAPVLISYDCELKVHAGNDGIKKVKLKDIYTGDGVKPRIISNNELVSELIIPLKPQRKCVFKKLRLRESLEFTSLSTSVSVNERGGINIVLAGMDPRPVLVETDSKEEINALVKRILKLCRAVDNDFFSRAYRRDMVKVFIQSSYRELGIL